MRTFVAESGKTWNLQIEGLGYTLTDSEGGSEVLRFETGPKLQADLVWDIRIILAEGGVEQHPHESSLPLILSIENAIQENPEEVSSYAALADILMEQDHPAQQARGEFIRVQLALEDPSLSLEERERLQTREAELLTAHSHDWLGCCANIPEPEYDLPSGRGQLPFSTPATQFQRGLLRVVTIPEMNLKFVRAFVTDSRTRFVRELRIGEFAYEELTPEEIGETCANFSCPACPVLKGWPYFENLRVFQYGWSVDEDYGAECWWQCHQHETDMEWVSNMQQIEELHLFASGTDLDYLIKQSYLKHLRILQIYHNWEYPLTLLAKNSGMRNLTHLLLHPKADGAWGDVTAPYIKAADIQEVLISPHLQKLTHLRMRMADVGDAGCEMIVDSGILKRLKMLDLRHGNITDVGAKILAECPDVANLELLDLRGNDLTTAGVEALSRVVPGLRAEHQQSETNNREWLINGDYE